jgi:hypothetical protein
MLSLAYNLKFKSNLSKCLDRLLELIAAQTSGHLRANPCLALGYDRE